MNGDDQIQAQLEEDLRNFTDRDEAAGLIRKQVDAAAQSAMPMLMFYGVGGAGKSVLAARLRQIFQRELPSAFIDFETGTVSNPLTQHPPLAPLLEIARQLKMICPRFELAYAALLKRQDQVAQMRSGEREESDAEDLIEEGVVDTLEEAAELAEVAPLGIGFLVKLVRMGWDRTHLPARQKVYREYQKTPAGKQLIGELSVASPNRLAARLIGLLGEDLAERLPKRPGKACRALIVLDTIEHLRRTGQSGLQEFTERECWIFEFWKALRGPEQQPFVQIVLLGREPLSHWCEYLSEIREVQALEQHLLGGFPEPEAKAYLRKKGVTDLAMQEAILHSAADEADSGSKRYHVLSLGLLADTVAAGKSAGKEISPDTLKLPPGQLDKLAMRFLQSMRTPTEERRMVRLARTPRFDEKALKQICSPDRDTNKEERKQILEFTFIQKSVRAGWLVVHPRVREALLQVSRYSEPDEVNEQHQEWQKLWQDRSEKETDEFAGLAWFHSYQLDPKKAMTAWSKLAGEAAAARRIEDHHQLTDWWVLTGVETAKNLNEVQATGLAVLGTEILRLAMNLPGSDLGRAAACLQKVLTVITRDKNAKRWARLKTNLGVALSEQGGRSGGPEGLNMLIEAESAFRDSLTEFTGADSEKERGDVLHNLGNLLTQRAERCPGTTALEFLIQAESAFQLALGIFNEQLFPEDWATVQNNFGNAARDHGLRVAGPDCIRLLTQAEMAHHAALRVRKPEKDAAAWGVAQNNLGMALMELGARQAGPEAASHLSAAVAASREALKVAVELRLRGQISMAQSNLGSALREAGWRRVGRGGGPMLKEALENYRAALKTYSEYEFPPQRAAVLSDLAGALLLQGCLADEGVGPILEAKTTLVQALKVFTREDFPLDWAMTQNSLGNASRELALRESKQNRATLLREAIKAYELAMEVRSRETLPQQWAMTQNDRAVTLREQALLLALPEKAVLFEQAIRMHEHALTVLTRADLPQPWAFAIDSLGVTLRAQAEQAPAQEAANLLAKAIQAHNSALEIFTIGDFPYLWAATHKNLGDALRAQSIRVDADDQKRLKGEAAAAYRVALEVFTPEESPRQWKDTTTSLSDII